MRLCRVSSYHLAPSLVTLRNEINRAHPHRDHTSDGWIGDPNHAARKSDHNPDYDHGGVVRAIDVDKDGINPTRLVAIAIKDPRTEYVIWNGYIWSRQYGFRKRVYNGTNKHRTHVHISIRHGASYETSTKRWGYYPVLKSLAVVAREVIDGKWGNGDERKRRLTAAGYNYAAVQAEVNRQLS